MEGQDHQPPRGRLEGLHRQTYPLGQVFKFRVDCNSEGQERRGRLPPFAPLRRGLRRDNHLRELPRRADRLALALADDRSGDLPDFTLIEREPQDPPQLILREIGRAAVRERV